MRKLGEIDEYHDPMEDEEWIRDTEWPSRIEIWVIRLLNLALLLLVFLLGVAFGYDLKQDDVREFRLEICEKYPDAENYVSFCRPEEGE